MILDNCYINNDSLLACSLFKEQIGELLIKNGDRFKLSILNDNYGIYNFDSVLNIIINYENINKVNIFISIDKLMTHVVEKNNYIVFETNINSMDNVISGKFNLNFTDNDDNGAIIQSECYFKKNHNNKNILVLCASENKGTYHLLPTDEQNELNDINIKYNFTILPFNNTEEFIITNYTGSIIYNAYPQKLNFYEEDNFVVRYILTNSDSEFLENIKLNIFGNNLDCISLSGILQCKVPMSHFDYEQNGIYNTNYINSLGEWSTYYEATPFEVILPERKMIRMMIKEIDNKKEKIIGKEGSFYLITDYNDTENIFNISDIEEQTLFNTIIKDDIDNKYNVTCRLWNPSSSKIILICKLKEELRYQQQNIKLNNSYFNYYEYKIVLYSEISIIINQLNYEIPFLYSDKQKIDIKAEDEKEEYNLRFKFDSYNGEPLILLGTESNMLIIDDCEFIFDDDDNNAHILCHVKIQKLEETLIQNGEIFKLKNLDENLIMKDNNFDLVFDIIINYEVIEKEDISLEITDLKDNISEIYSSFAYETNISTINNIRSKYIYLNFSSGQEKCYFKKQNKKNLLVICIPSFEGELYLEEIKQEKIINNTHYKYNFIIQPRASSEIIYIQHYGSQALYVYPEILNFTLESTLEVNFIMINSSNVAHIRLNPDSFDLPCEDFSDIIKKCNVSVNHFMKKKSGFYYTYHLNHEYDLSIYYDLNPIEIELPNILKIKLLNSGEITIGRNGTLYFITNFNDTLYDLFNISDIEEKTSFNIGMEMYDSNKEYNAACRLWKPLKDNIRIFCNLDETLNEGINYIEIKPSSFEYDFYKIIINPDTINYAVNQINSVIPFIYSDTQIINYDEDKEIYELRFKYDNYNNEILVIHSNEFDYKIMENCVVNDKDLKCEITKDTLDEILQKNNSNYKLMYYNDNLGIKNIENCFDIIIYANAIDKENIDIEIVKLSENNYDINNLIAYETNITSLPNLITSSFQLFLNNHNETSLDCFFKKYEEGPLLLLCLSKEEGEFSL